MIITIEQDIVSSKLNTDQLKGELAAALSLNESLIGISLLRDLDGNNPRELKIELPDDTDLSALNSTIEAHQPAKSDIDIAKEKPSTKRRLDILEAKVLALEGK